MASLTKASTSALSTKQKPTKLEREQNDLLVLFRITHPIPGSLMNKQPSNPQRAHTTLKHMNQVNLGGIKHRTWRANQCLRMGYLTALMDFLLCSTNFSPIDKKALHRVFTDLIPIKKIVKTMKPKMDRKIKKLS